MPSHTRFASLFFSIILFLGFICAIAGCGGGSASGGPPPTPTPNPSASPTPTPSSSPSPSPKPSPSPSPSPNPSASPTPTQTPIADDKTLQTEDVATGLDNPWALAFAPDGRLFFTEPPGRLRVIDKTGLVAQPVIDIGPLTDGVTGMDLDPDFATNGRVYMHYCTNDGTHCRIASVIVSGNSGSFGKVLFDYAIGNGSHVGGRLKIGPDRLMYLATGDHLDPASAQDLNSWNGKILRMNLDGTAAAGNPFPFPGAPFVYALGLRDPEGLAWDAFGNLYSTDNGDVSNDEVNLIVAGGNYGWPTCQGICNDPRFIDPVKLFHPETAPPSGAMFYHGPVLQGWDGSMVFAVLGLADNNFAHHVHQLFFDRPGGKTVVREQILWQNKFGRIRDVVEGPDGFLYFSTSNQHTSVTGNPGDDRIVRARPAR